MSGYENKQTIWDAYTSWIQSRSDGVKLARGRNPASAAKLYIGLEFNLVRDLKRGVDHWHRQRDRRRMRQTLARLGVGVSQLRHVAPHELFLVVAESGLRLRVVDRFRISGILRDPTRRPEDRQIRFHVGLHRVRHSWRRFFRLRLCRGSGIVDLLALRLGQRRRFRRLS